MVLMIVDLGRVRTMGQAGSQGDIAHWVERLSLIGVTLRLG